MQTESSEGVLPATEDEFPPPFSEDNGEENKAEDPFPTPLPPPPEFEPELGDFPLPDYNIENQTIDMSEPKVKEQNIDGTKNPPPPKASCPDLAIVDEPGVAFKSVSEEETVKHVNALSDIPVRDPQPSIEGSSLALQYLVNFDTNFGDRNAYITGNARFLEEATVHADLKSMLDEGQTYVVMLYTWRSCSGAFMSITQKQEEVKKEMREEFFNMMEPLVTKLSTFMQFTKNAVDRFGQEVKQLCRKEKQKDFVSEAYLLTLGKLINMFAEMNNLLNTKSSITNDYACYRRTVQAASRQLDLQQIQESQNLSMFLATQNSVMDLLKEALKVTPNYDDLLFDIVTLCMKMYDQEQYFDPLEKYMLIKGIAVCLFLIDREGCIMYKAAAKKNINIAKVDKIFKQMQVVPLYGDVQIYPYTYMQLSCNFDAGKWVVSESSQPSPQANILSKLTNIRTEHRSYICHLAQIRTAAECRKKSGTIATDAENLELYTTALRGLQLTSSWTQHLLEVYCWKLLHPTCKQDNPNCPNDATDYEKSIRYNYNSKEKFAMVEIIAMIKGLQRLLVNMESIFQDAITRHVYTEIQNFVHLALTQAANHAGKKKKQYLKIILMGVIDICQDSLKGKSEASSEIPRKCVGPTSTQLYMTRTMLESILTTKAHRKDVDQQWLRAFDKFHRESFNWSYMLNFGETLQKCCDLSQLWYREFFLEMTKGQRIQFPTEMSLPWILTDHILESKDPAMIEYVLYPFDLYNDSAQYALNNFHRQHLYDEIEAEVNLVFDQFVFKVSNQIFAHYKHRAGCMMMTKLQKVSGTPGRRKKSTPKAPPAFRYTTLLKQRHVRILGRTVDMNRLITQKMTNALIEAVDTALTRFEASDVTNIMELKGLLQCNRLAHSLLSKHLALKDFDDILKEANDEVHNQIGRITRHLENEIVNDFIPNYCFNSTTDRFVKSVLPDILKESEMLERGRMPDCSPEFVWGTKDLNKYNSAIYSPYRGFVGPLHFETIAHLIGYQGVIYVIQKLLKLVEENLKSSLPQIVQMLLDVISEDSRLPLFTYGATGMLAKYQAVLVNIIQYPDLKLDVLHRFAIVGNSILFCLFIERGLMTEDVAGLTHACLFQNRIPPIYISSKEISDTKKRHEEVKKRMEQLEKDYSKCHIHSVMSKFGNCDQIRTSDFGYQLTRDRLCLRQPIFIKILEKIRSFLDDKVWQGNLVDHESRLNFSKSKGFHHLWSAIQFFYCIPVGEQEFTTESLHGEGVYWAGCALIVLLGQQERFETLDFSYYLRKIFLNNIVDDTIKGIEIGKMMTLIRNHKFLNDQIFAMLNNFIGEPKETARKKDFKTFEPPLPPPPPDDARVSVC